MQYAPTEKKLKSEIWNQKYHHPRVENHYFVQYRVGRDCKRAIACKTDSCAVHLSVDWADGCFGISVWLAVCAYCGVWNGDSRRGSHGYFACRRIFYHQFCVFCLFEKSAPRFGNQNPDRNACSLFVHHYYFNWAVHDNRSEPVFSADFEPVCSLCGLGRMPRRLAAQRRRTRKHRAGFQRGNNTRFNNYQRNDSIFNNCLTV